MPVFDAKNEVSENEGLISVVSKTVFPSPFGDSKKARFFGITYIIYMKDRIKQVQDSQHLNNKSFSEMTGIGTATLSNIYSGRTEPTLKQVDAIKKTFPNINLEWLLYGRGVMFKDSQADEASPADNGTTVHEALLDFGSPTAVPSPQRVESPAAIRPQNQTFQPERTIAKNIDKPQRKITEIRIFYDDQTWETFVPKK